MDIVIPNLGDGIESAVVISILVQPGESVTQDQTLFELETDKAVAPVGAVEAGVIDSITVSEGDTVTNGKIVGAMTSKDGGSSSASVSSQPAAQAPVPIVPTVAQPVAQQPVVQQAVVSPVTTSGQVRIISENPVTSISIQQLAYRIGLDLRYIQGTGSGGRILESDVINHVAYMQSLLAQPISVPAQAVPVTPKSAILPDFSKWGDIEIEKCSPLRKKIAQKMVDSWQSIPHVTQQLDVDITHVMGLRKQYNPTYIKKDAKLTLTVFVIRAVQKALELFPQFNSSYDSEKNELIKKSYINIGIAVDTPNGLIVPVIKDVSRKSLLDLSQELSSIAQKAKDRTLSVEELQGGTFTISNLGGLGVGSFTPIINTPEVAILGLGTGELKPVFDEKKNIKHVLKMPTCLSYDHRIIDGADGARFAIEVKNQFETFSESELKEL